MTEGLTEKFWKANIYFSLEMELAGDLYVQGSYHKRIDDF